MKAPLTEPDHPVTGMADTRFGAVALIGPPNAGKSTLTNALLGRELSIVNHKVETTRRLVSAVLTENSSQVVVTDTPGIGSTGAIFGNLLSRLAAQGARAADRAVVVLDASSRNPIEGLSVLRNVPRRLPRDLVLNKIDRVSRRILLPLAAACNQHTSFEFTGFTSAYTGKYLGELRAHLLNSCPPGPWHFPADCIELTPPQIRAEELTRGVILERCHDEVPYSLSVETTGWKERQDGSVHVQQDILVGYERHKAILIGAGGTMIRTLSVLSRGRLSALLCCPVHMRLLVRVRRSSAQAEDFARREGIDLSSGKRKKARSRRSSK